MNGKKIFQAVNGKKLPIAAVSFIIMTSVGYGQLLNKVETNTCMINELKPVTTEVTTQVATIKANVENLEKNFDDFRGEYSKDQRVMREDVKKILQLVGGR